MKLYQGKNYHIVTYGCQMNVHESEKIAGGLVSLGMKHTDKINLADVIVFNTCCIREGAEDRAFSNISALKKLKKSNKDLIIILCGCMPQQANGKYDFKNKLSFVDIVIGTFNMHLIAYYLSEFAKNKKRIYEIVPKHYDNEDLIQSVRDDKINAYVNIIYGCNNFCTYCIVPYVKGRERSRPQAEIEKEVKFLAEKGYKYITLLGQNVNSYGKDFKNDNFSFAKLLDSLCRIKGDFKIKFLTSHPKDLSDDVIKVICSNDKISKHLHLPLQAGSDRILKLMNRHYNKKQYLSIIKKIKKLNNNFTFSTDIIVGFPSEKHSDYLQTVKLVKKVKFTQIFTFMYSKRKGTPAYDYASQIAEDVKNFRINNLLAVQKCVNNTLTKSLINKTFSVLISKQKNLNIGLSDSGKTFIIESKIENYQQFYNVVVDSVKNGSIYAKVARS